MINISVKRMPIAQAPHVQKALKIIRFLYLPVATFSGLFGASSAKKCDSIAHFLITFHGAWCSEARLDPVFLYLHQTSSNKEIATITDRSFD
jgi:hypothetical protein